MADAKLDPALCRRMAKRIGASTAADDLAFRIWVIGNRDALVAQLTAAADLEPIAADEVRAVVREAVNHEEVLAGHPAIATIADRVAEKLAGRMVGLSAENRVTAEWLRHLASVDPLRHQQHDPVVAEHTRRCLDAVEWLDRLLARTHPVQTIGIGPEWTAILVQALEYWDRDLTAPHMQIREIREALTGTVTS